MLIFKLLIYDFYQQNLENSDIKPAYEADEGPLTEEFLEFLRKKAAESIPNGKIISMVSLFDIDFVKLNKD